MCNRAAGDLRLELTKYKYKLEPYSMYPDARKCLAAFELNATTIRQRLFEDWNKLEAEVSPPRPGDVD
jgi:hypothetical protein